MPETKFQTSFIPKQPVNEEPKQSGGSSILFLVGFLIFVATAAAGVGVFIWQKTINSQIESGNKQLAEYEKKLDPFTISEFIRLDNRIDVAEALLKSHTSASAVFPKLQDNTLRSLRFNSYSYSNGGDGKIIVSMTGEAQDYETLALQAKAFTEPELKNTFRSPIFSSFSKGREFVVFTFSTGIDPYVVQYYAARQKAISDANSQNNQTLPQTN